MQLGYSPRANSSHRAAASQAEPKGDSGLKRFSKKDMERTINMRKINMDTKKEERHGKTKTNSLVLMTHITCMAM